MNKKKFHLAGEVALLIVLLINSLGVDLMSKSGFGISTISSVPLVFNIAFPVFSFGTWNYIFQTLLVITLMILKRSFCPGYLFSFVVGIGFGKMIDVHNAWIQALPNSLPLHYLLCIPDWKNRFRHPEFSWKTRGILPCNWEEESCS